MPDLDRDRRFRSLYDAGAAELRCAGAPDSDLAVLGALADGLVADIRRWRALTDRLDHAACRRLDPNRAAGLLLESVFDEVLIAPACGVLSALLRLAPARA